MKLSHAAVDADRFGPWALVTGASSGIGKEFARQLAANGINIVLVARRATMLEDIGRDLAGRYGVDYRTVGVDLSEPGFLDRVIEVTADLDVGLLVSNAGTGLPGKLLTQDLESLHRNVALNTTAHLDLTHHFGRRLARRGRGGVVLVSALGAPHGLPNMANAAATKAYVSSLGEGLHIEFAQHNLNVSVLYPGPTDTPILAELGFQPDTSPMKPMPVRQCVMEGLAALAANRVTHIPGRLNRIMAAVIPHTVITKMMGRMVGQWVTRKTAPVTP